MKKVISAILMLTMLVSMFAVSASAEMYVQTDFTNMETLAASFHAGAYYIEDEGLLYGYAEAVCLQSKGEWYQYDTEAEVNFNDDDLSEDERDYALWYCNVNLESYGRFDGTNYMRFKYDIDNKVYTLTATDLNDGETTIDLLPPVPGDLADDEYHTFGMSVSEKRIRCFVNGQMIFDFVDANDDYLIGRQDENTNPTPLVFWQDGNFLQVKSVKIASPGYLYPFNMEVETSETTTAGGNNDVTTTTEATEATTTKETTTRIETSVVVKDDGETEIVTEIITEATTPAPAATNTGKPQGGSSTATGDATFVVVAAMVATLGCALIIRKVNA